MKKNNNTKHIIVIILTFLVMALAIYAVYTGKILTQYETAKNIEKRMIEKLK